MRARTPVLSLLAGLVAACADGGEEDRPKSEVRFTNQNHLFGFKSLRGFGEFPVQTSAVFTDRGVLNLFDDSTYTVARATSTSAQQDYALTADGKLSIYLLGGGNEPSTVFFGAYGRVGASGLLEPGDTPDFFFTDRVSTPNSQAVGLFYGTEKIEGAVDLRGQWNLFSLHAIFDAGVQSPQNVGRAAHGRVAFTGAGPEVALGISGTGFQSGTQGAAAGGLNLGGAIQVVDAADSDGSCTLTINYNADAREMRAATNRNVVFALDEDETDDEAGIALMVREFDNLAPATTFDEDDVDGVYYVGGHTLFVNPADMGSDTIVGTMTLGPASASGGAFVLDYAGNDGVQRSYSGEWTANAFGKLTITIRGTNETWHGAIDRTYNTIVVCDDFAETRSSNQIELNLMLGVRKKTD